MPEPKGKLVVPCGFTAAGLLRAFGVTATDELIVNDAGTNALLSLLQFDGAGYLQVADVRLETILEFLSIDGDSQVLVQPDITDTYLTGQKGWFSTAWQKNPILRGLSGNSIVPYSSTTTPAGNVNVNATTVPAGECHKITVCNIRAISTTVNRLIISVFVGANAIILYDNLAPVSGTWYIWNGNIDLFPGDYIQYRYFNCTLNDPTFGYYIETRTDIDQ